MDKLRLANKKNRRQQKRKLHRSRLLKQQQAIKVRNKRMRKMMIQGRKEDLATRRGHVDYVKQLESEVMDGQT